MLRLPVKTVGTWVKFCLGKHAQPFPMLYSLHSFNLLHNQKLQNIKLQNRLQFLLLSKVDPGIVW